MTHKPSALLPFNYCLYTMKRTLLLLVRAGRALVSCSRTWCFSRTNTCTTHWLFRGSNQGQDSVCAQGHVTAPCRYTVSHIIEDEADDRRVMKETEARETQTRRPIHSFMFTSLQATHAPIQCTDFHNGDTQYSQCTLSRSAIETGWFSA